MQMRSGHIGLSLEHVSVHFGETCAVHDVSVQVLPGETLGIVGKSGAGKSTLLHAITRLLDPSAQVDGIIRLDGKNLLELDEGQLRRMRGERIATIFQNPARTFDPSMRIGKQIAELVRAHRNSETRTARAEVRDEARALLERMGFEGIHRVMRAYPFELSGGMLQRVAIACAMAFEPEVLLADEPTSALDSITQAQIVDELIDLRKQSGMAMLVVTHNIALASKLCDRVIVMEHGRVVEEGTAEQVIRNPQSVCAQSLVEAVPRVVL